MSNFSFSHSVFRRFTFQTRKNQGLFVKGLMYLQKVSTHFAQSDMGRNFLRFINVICIQGSPILFLGMKYPPNKYQQNNQTNKTKIYLILLFPCLGSVFLHGGTTQPLLVLRYTAYQNDHEWTHGERVRCPGIPRVGDHLTCYIFTALS